jgi:uncharacterized protein YpuA (DUF1002 family)
VVNWIHQALTTEKLVHEIEEASRRINALVTSIKSYTHMGQAQEKAPADIKIGIRNTLTLLQHKIKKKQHQNHRSFLWRPSACAHLCKRNESGLDQPDR